MYYLSPGSLTERRHCRLASFSGHPAEPGRRGDGGAGHRAVATGAGPARARARDAARARAALRAARH